MRLRTPAARGSVSTEGYGPGALSLYITGVGLAALVALGGFVAVLGAPDLDRGWLMGAISSLTAFEVIRAVRLRVATQGDSRGHEEALLLFALLLLPPFDALITFTIGAMAGEIVLRRGVAKAVFNVGQFVAGAAIACALAGSLSNGGTTTRSSCVALFAVFVFSAFNRAAVGGVLALIGAEPFWRNLSQDLGPDTLNWLGTVAVGLLAGLSGETHVWAVPFALAALVPLSVALSGHARIRSARAIFADLVDSSVAGIFAADAAGRLRTWNPEMERITGYSSHETVGRPLESVMALFNEDGTPATDLLSGAPLDQADSRRLVRLEVAARESRWLMLSRAMLPDGGCAFVTHDITEHRAAVAALADRETRLRLALEAGRMGWWHLDPLTGRVEHSESLDAMLGLAPGMFGGSFEDFLSIVHPDDRHHFQKDEEDLSRLGHEERRFRIVRPTGEIRWLASKGNALTDIQGRPRAITGVTSDVTDRVEAEMLVTVQSQVLEELVSDAPLPEMLAHLTSVVESHAGGAFASLLLLDEDGLQLRHFASPSLPEAYARAIDGMPIDSPLNPYGPAVLQAAPFIVSDIQGEPAWIDLKPALPHHLRTCWSTAIVAADGTPLGTFALHLPKRRGPRQHDQELLAMATRLAGIAVERARQATKLEAAQTKYQRLVEQLPFAVYIIEEPDDGEPSNWRTTYISPQIEEMLGYPPAAWTETPGLFARVLHEDDRAHVLKEIRSSRTNQRRLRCEYRLIARDGRIVWIEDSSTFVHDGDGGCRRVEGQLVDISERKAIEQNLFQAQKMEAIGQLAGGVAHDFNNMMGAVIGFSELALARLDDRDRVRRYLEEIGRAGERASDITRQLLAFSRKQMLQARVLDLNEVVSNTKSLLARLIDENIDVVSTTAPQLGRVCADRGQIEQVIINLALNARDAMPQGGMLTIETANVTLGGSNGALGLQLDAPAGPYVRLSVTDTGSGIDETTLSHIFEPFFTTKAPGEGTGLGLASVFGVIKQSGGDISVHSKVGTGSTFSIYLPRYDGTSTAATSNRTQSATPHGTETILLVEDEELVRALGCEILEALGYTVLAAERPARAIELFQNHPGKIDLLLTDVVMPDLNGPELASLLTQHDPELKVLYTSGYPGDAIARHGVAEQDVVLAKPLKGDQLAREIRQRLDSD